MKKPTLMALALALVLAGLYFALPYLKNRPAIPEPAEPPKVVEKVPVPEKPPIIHPIPQAPVVKPETPARPLPSLDDSDEAVREEMSSIFPRQNPAKVFILDHFIRRLVLAIDSLPRKQLPADRLPSKPAPAAFIVEGPEGQEIISRDNYQRYKPFMAFVEAMDSEQAVDLYVRFYPLFQQAYRDMGYPRGYFNDRLIEVIDHLLATPEVEEPVRVIRHVVRYRFASPELEALSAGRKILIRIGPDNAATVKEKLRQIRAGILSLTPQN